MAVTRERKGEQLKELVDKFARTKTVVFADYRGLDVASLSKLRRELRKGNSELSVGKKTLMRIAAKQNNLPEIDDASMAGPVAATFSYEDEMAGIKILFKFSKENEKLKLLGGIIEGKLVSADVIKQYAKLPGREELLAKFMGSVNAPVSNMVGLLNNLIAGFVRVLNATKDKMAEPASGGPAVEEAPAAETPAAETPAEPAAEAPAAEATPEAPLPAEGGPTA